MNEQALIARPNAEGVLLDIAVGRIAARVEAIGERVLDRIETHIAQKVAEYTHLGAWVAGAGFGGGVAVTLLAVVVWNRLRSK